MKNADYSGTQTFKRLFDDKQLNVTKKTNLTSLGLTKYVYGETIYYLFEGNASMLLSLPFKIKTA